MSRALYALNTHRHVQYTVRTSMRVHADLKVFSPTRIISINKMGPFFTLYNLPLAVFICLLEFWRHLLLICLPSTWGI